MHGKIYSVKSTPDNFPKGYEIHVNTGYEDLQHVADFLYIGQKALRLRDWWKSTTSFVRPVPIVPDQTPPFQFVTPLCLFVFDAIITIILTLLYPEGDA